MVPQSSLRKQEYLPGTSKSCCLRITMETAASMWLEGCISSRSYPLAVGIFCQVGPRPLSREPMDHMIFLSFASHKR
jgi:hypothetical protein